jgi:hypothetical protein
MKFCSPLDDTVYTYRIYPQNVRMILKPRASVEVFFFGVPSPSPEERFDYYLSSEWEEKKMQWALTNWSFIGRRTIDMESTPDSSWMKLWNRLESEGQRKFNALSRHNLQAAEEIQLFQQTQRFWAEVRNTTIPLLDDFRRDFFWWERIQ